MYIALEYFSAFQVMRLAAILCCYNARVVRNASEKKIYKQFHYFLGNVENALALSARFKLQNLYS